MLEIVNRYFNWMCELIRADEEGNYTLLLEYLDEVEFTYILPMDENRADDGLNFRERFGYECDIDERDILEAFGDKPCSVLEMVVALAHRCEESIMDTPEYGDRTSRWFWEMIFNLGLGDMTDDNFDGDYIVGVIERFLNRDYEPNGIGGLFTIDGPNDLRYVDIWYQMCWHLVDITRRED